MDGLWRQDLLDRLQASLGSVRRQAWGEPSLAINPFRAISKELACLYDSETEIRHDSGDVAGLSTSIRLSGLWGMMQRVEYYTIGLREMLVRIHVPADGRPSYRPVYPDLVLAGASPDRPDLPIVVKELRLRRDPATGKDIWTLDVLDVSDPENPIYRISKVESGLSEGEDLTSVFLGGSMSGEAYPYRRSDGRPHLPYVLYHASKLGDRLWDPWEGLELVDATLDLAVLHCLLVHAYRDASWPQRYACNLHPAGASIVDGDQGRRAEVLTDPASLLILETKEGEGQGQPMIGQWQAGADVSKLEETLSNLVSRVAQDAGVPPSDVQRLGGTARSGVAISLTNEGKRAAQRRFSSQFRDGDERLVAVTAAMVNRATGSAYPEWGYSVSYREIPLSPDELKARREHVLALVQAGLMSGVSAYRELNPGLSEEQARQDLASIARVKATGLA